MQELGAFLRELRGKESLRDVMERSGVSHNYLSIIEKGVDPRTKSPVKPSPDTLRSLAEAYHYDYENLMRIAGYLDGEITHDQAKNVVSNSKYARLPQEKKKIIDDLIDVLSE